MKHILIIILVIFLSSCTLALSNLRIPEQITQDNTESEITTIAMDQEGAVQFPEDPVTQPTRQANSPRDSSSNQGQFSSLPDLGEAPELTNEVWLNTDSPLRLADLSGKVVLLEMWTFG